MAVEQSWLERFVIEGLTFSRYREILKFSRKREKWLLLVGVGNRCVNLPCCLQ